MRDLAKGQNLPLPSGGAVVSLHLGPESLDLALVSLDAQDRVLRLSTTTEVREPGVAVLGPRAWMFAVAALDPAAHRWWAVVTPADPGRGLSALPAARAVVESDGTPVALFESPALVGETALVVLELYRRGTELKVRAVGQGHRDGWSGLLAPHGGIPGGMDLTSRPPAPAPGAQAPTGAHPASPSPAPPAIPPGGVAPPAPPSGLAAAGDPFAPLPPGTAPAERHLQTLRGIFEDLARSTAGYQSSVTYAERRRETELQELAGDPRLRLDPTARQQADDRYDHLVLEAGRRHLQDMTQLRGEIDALEPALPAQLADWSSPAWQGPTGHPTGGGIRIGVLTGERSPEVKLPWAMPVPLPRPLWVPGRGPASVEVATSVITRLLATAPAGSWRLRVVDADGDLARALSDPAVQPLLEAPPALHSSDLPQVLAAVQRRTDLLDMAARGGALDALPPGIHPGPLLLVLSGAGPQEESELSTLVQALRGAAPTEVLLVGDIPETARALDAIPLPADEDLTVTDGWVGLTWRMQVDRGPHRVRWQDLARRAL